MKLISIVFNKATSEYRLYYKDKETGKPYHITANHLLDKEKLWARGANYHQDPYRISWTLCAVSAPGTMCGASCAGTIRQPISARR